MENFDQEEEVRYSVAFPWRCLHF